MLILPLSDLNSRNGPTFGLTPACVQQYHTLRHSFVTHLIEDSYNIRTVQGLLGHKDVGMTTIYTHVLNRGG